MPLLLNNITNLDEKFRYHGVDIVESVINKVKKRFGEKKNWKFDSLDITRQPLPTGYDLIYSRDALQHLPLLKVVDALENIANTKDSRYFLVGSYLNSGISERRAKINNNNNIRAGDYFSINLTQFPFYLNSTMKNFKEAKDGIQKYLVLYDIPDYLKTIDFESMRKRISEKYTHSRMH